MPDAGWIEELAGSKRVFRPEPKPEGVIVAFSGRGVAPSDEPSPTAHLARKFASAIGLEHLPIVRATQVHGAAAHTVRGIPRAGTARDAGEFDILVTDLSRIALVVQTADCVPIVLSAPGMIGVAHAGWRGSAKNAAGAAVEALVKLGCFPFDIRAWLGPSIRSCCYEVGGEVAAQFAGETVRQSCEGKFRLDLAGVNAAQLTAAGVPPDSISIHPSCTKCGGEKFASFRRDGQASGRMIALVARL
jgi:YfiH family protein